MPHTIACTLSVLLSHELLQMIQATWTPSNSYCSLNKSASLPQPQKKQPPYCGVYKGVWNTTSSRTTFPSTPSLGGLWWVQSGLKGIEKNLEKVQQRALTDEVSVRKPEKETLNKDLE